MRHGLREGVCLRIGGLQAGAGNLPAPFAVIEQRKPVDEKRSQPATKPSDRSAGLAEKLLVTANRRLFAADGKRADAVNILG